MTIIKCKRCEADFEQEHFNEKYCSSDCSEESRKESRREYMREYMAKKRETLYFSLEDAIEKHNDKLEVAFYRTPGLHDFIHTVAKNNRVIALQISGNDVGVIIASDASEEE